MKCNRNSDGRAIDRHSRQVMRQQAIKAVREGQTAQSVAAAFGVNVRNAFRWLAGFASGGQKALLTKPIPGRPSINLDRQQVIGWAIERTIRCHALAQSFILMEQKERATELALNLTLRDKETVGGI